MGVKKGVFFCKNHAEISKCHFLTLQKPMLGYRTGLTPPFFACRRKEIHVEFEKVVALFPKYNYIIIIPGGSICK
jgi:hypothetical protein